jgi:diacylglycerol O-acyltransferase 1
MPTITQATVSTSVDVHTTATTTARTPTSLNIADVPALSEQARARSKYRHFAAYHSKSRPSCLSRDSTTNPSFIGFRNLMVIVLSEFNSWSSIVMAW